MSMRLVVSANRNVRKLPRTPSNKVTPIANAKHLQCVEAALEDHLVDNDLNEKWIGKCEELNNNDATRTCRSVVRYRLKKTM